MRNIIIAALAASFAFAPIAAHAEKQVTRTVKEISDFPELEKKAKEVCGSKSALSDKLKAACAAGTFPSVTKAGLFRNTGIGAELNTLMRQGS
jgi:hypothetical protein